MRVAARVGGVSAGAIARADGGAARRARRASASGGGGDVVTSTWRALDASPARSARARARAAVALRRRVISRADSDDQEARRAYERRFISRADKARNRENAQTWAIVGSIALAMTAAIAVVYESSSDGFLYGIDSVESYADAAAVGGGFDFDVASGSRLSAAGAVGALVWAIGLYFASPVSVIMLFLGRTDSERPSDWVLRKVTGIKTTEDASVAERAGVFVWFALAGVAVSALGDALLGDESWQISAGFGFLAIAGVSELGRPKRVDEATLKRMEAQYADFCAFADSRLTRSGRVHQSEISRAFRQAYPQYAREDVLAESDFRTLLANYAPWSERSGRGYYKNLSLRPLAPRPSVKDLGL